jgi:quercetin dioxygenase-like cupin family protein
LFDLKTNATRSGSVTPPEVTRGLESVGSVAEYDDDRRARVHNLIVNDHVMVTWERYEAGSYSADPMHFHPHDAVVIYLQGGYIWRGAGFDRRDRVRRGDIRIVPGNALHTTSNAGADPLEFLLIIPT